MFLSFLTSLEMFSFQNKSTSCSCVLPLHLGSKFLLHPQEGRQIWSNCLEAFILRIIIYLVFVILEFILKQRNLKVCDEAIKKTFSIKFVSWFFRIKLLLDADFETSASETIKTKLQHYEETVLILIFIQK